MASEEAMALSCQRNDERSWKPNLDAARELASDARVMDAEVQGLP
jgi:hypothetical protein